MNAAGDPRDLSGALGLSASRVISICGAGGKTSLLFALAAEFAARGERVWLTTTTKLGADQVSQRWPGRQAGDADAIAALACSATQPLLTYRTLDRTLGKAIGYEPGFVDHVAAQRWFGRILIEADGAAHRPLKAPAAHEPVIPSCTDAVVMVAGASGLGEPLDERCVFRPGIFAALSDAAPGQAVSAQALARVIAHRDGLARGAPASATRSLLINQADDAGRLALAREVLLQLAQSEGILPGHAAIAVMRPRVEVLHAIQFS